MATVDASRNPDLSGNDVKILGNHFAFTAQGGFEMARGFEKITRAADASFTEFDMTETVQILYDVRVFNEAIGIYKDHKNELVITADSDESYVTSDGEVLMSPFTIDTSSVTIDASNFQHRLTTQNALTGNPIVSVGVYASMYEEFEQYVRTYFGYFGGFASLFNNSTTYDISGQFDEDGMYELMTAGAVPDSGNGYFINDLSGSFTISGINELIRHAVDTNLFNNRDPSGHTYEDSDASFNSVDGSGNWGIRDGFIADDLIFLREGTTIDLRVEIAPEAYFPINNISGSGNNPFLTDLLNSQQASFQAKNTSVDLSNNFITNTTTELELISRTLKAPLLIRLANLTGANAQGEISETTAFGTQA